MQATFTYPPMPQGVDEKIIQPSPAFRNEVFKVLGAIVFFIFSYIVLVGVALGFAAVCGLLAFWMVTTFPKFFTLMLGLGLVGLGIMTVFFLFKFVFSRNKVDRSGMIEIKEADQPELFGFIRQLTRETQTPFPKRIYLSPEVNASVFYDSGFWSMFLPIRKNLTIGLGLVNCVNMSELKAILAHEFGHFSQRSMKLGSYVYNVNKVLYNMLYENDGYAKALDKWGNVSDYFAIFASITVKVVQFLQGVLQKVYLIVNKNYLSLSRQMEFHADAVAAYVTGSTHLVTSLHRLEAADMCYNRLFEQYDTWLKENLKPDNIYPQHTEVMAQLSKQLKIPVQHGLPQVNAQTFALFNQSRLVIKDQWASHPSTEDRETHLNHLNIPSDIIHESAWSVFRNAEELQKQMTVKIYEGATFSKTPEVMSLTSFQEKYTREIIANSFHDLYKGFFDNRDITTFNPDTIAATPPETGDLEDILSAENMSLPGLITSLKRDIETLTEIQQGDTGIKNIDFDGRKYKYTEAPEIQVQLAKELEAAEAQLAALDNRIFTYFYQKAKTQGKEQELVAGYKNLFKTVKETEADIALYQKLMAEVHLLFTQDMTLEYAQSVLEEVKQHEKVIKARMHEILADGLFLPYYTPAQKEKLEEYLAVDDREYIIDNAFVPDAVDLLYEAPSIFIHIVTDRAFQIKKSLLQTQVDLLQTRSLEPELLKD